MKINKVNFVCLHGIIAMYSMSSIFSKLAALSDFPSLSFIFYYGLVVFILFLYAIAWQQILKTIPLSIASANKSVTILWTMFFGKIFFKEHISINMILGSVIILFGIFFVVSEYD